MKARSLIIIMLVVFLAACSNSSMQVSNKRTPIITGSHNPIRTSSMILYQDNEDADYNLYANFEYEQNNLANFWFLKIHSFNDMSGLANMSITIDEKDYNFFCLGKANSSVRICMIPEEVVRFSIFGDDVKLNFTLNEEKHVVDVPTDVRENLGLFYQVVKRDVIEHQTIFFR